MTQVVRKSLDLESQRVIQILIDKIIFIYQSKNYDDEIDILEKSCQETDIKLYSHFREDLLNICYYSCQIILNHNICLVCGTGNSKNESYKNAAGKFLKFCFHERNQSYPLFKENQSSFIYELNQSCENINTIDKFIEILKNCAFKNCKIDYGFLKDWLKVNNSKFNLSNSFYAEGNSVICSIYLNENLLLQQGQGETNEKALIQTFNEMLDAYSITSNPINETESKKEEIIKDKDVIIRKMAEKLKENKSCSVNYWIILEKCAQDLGFKMAIHNNKKKCAVNINDVEIINIDCDNDYCGYISACKDLLQLFENVAKRKNPPKENINISQIRDEKIKVIITKAKIIRQNDPSSSAWPIVNNAFLDGNMKLELHYENIKSKILCSFDCQGLQIVFAEGDNRPSSREAASLKLLNDSTYSN